MRAKDIIGLLADKHGNDVFVAECKDGPTWGGPHLRLDAWAMKRSWSQPTTWGYEVKVSRSDFLADEKWTGYLELCSDFYFVAPHGVIEPAELAPEVGLLCPSKNCRRLFTVKKAQRRPQVEIPESLYRYILMCRCRIVSGDRYAPAEHDEEFWRAWLRHRQDRESLAEAVRRGLSEDARRHLHELEEQNRRLQDDIKKCQQIKGFCEQIGLDLDRGVPSKWAVEMRINDLRQAVPRELSYALDSLQTTLNNFRQNLAKIEEQDT